MALSIKHRFVNGVPDSTDPADNTRTKPSAWNDTHVITVDTGKVIGRKSSGTGDAEQLSGSDLLDIIGPNALIDGLGYTPANKAGDTFTGPVILDDDPALPLGAATKQYVDDGLAAINVNFVQGGTGAVTRTMQNKAREIVSVTDFGAAGNGTTDDTAAVSAAINYIQSNGLGGTVYFPPGQYKITSALPDITKSVYLVGASPFSSRLILTGDFTIVQFKGSGSRCQYAGLRDLLIAGGTMTSAYAVKVDWAKSIYFQGVLIKSVWNGVNIRQAGDVSFQNCTIFDVQGDFGVLASATNTTRNGENDQIDLISFYNTIIQSSYVAGVGTNATTCLAVDGRVQTIQCDGLRLLNAGKGFVATNSNGLASNFIPRFLIGSGLEIENMYTSCFDATALMDTHLGWLFAAGAQTNNGVTLGPSVFNFRVSSGLISSNWFHGVYINQAVGVELDNCDIYFNSQVGAGVKSGVYIESGSGKVAGRGGVWGKNTTLPSYTETQKYGCEMSAAFSGLVVIDGVDMRGNNTGSIADSGLTATGSYVRGCPGINPGGAATASVGASPFAYTAGIRPEFVTVYGGTVSSVVIGGVTMFPSTNCFFALAPRQSVTITYTVAPTITVNKL